MPDLVITLEVAKIICKMDEVCYGEGIGPDTTELMKSIFIAYPELKEQYDWLLPK